ncbi:MAG: hypothetical protein PVH64_03030 [Bacillota bacterium]|jgi:hypothetical protein
MKKWCLGIMALLLIAGCLAGSIFAAENRLQSAKVYFIQPKATQSMYLFANGRFLSLLKRNTYCVADLKAGLNMIGFSKGKRINALNVFEFVPGKTYYIAVDYNGVHSLLNQIEGEQLLTTVRASAEFNRKRVQKRALKILKRSQIQAHESQVKGLLNPPAGEVIPVNSSTHNKIPQYIPVKLVFLDDVTSNGPTGNDIRFQVAEDVVINNQVRIPKGTPVKGRFLRMLPAGSLGSPGLIDIVIPRITIVGAGSNIAVIGRYTKAGVSEYGKTRNLRALGYLMIFSGPAQGFGTVCLEFLACDATASSIKGKDVTIPKGEVFTVWTRYNTYEGQTSVLAHLEANAVATLKANIPAEAVFPDIYAPPAVDLRRAYEVCFAKIKRYHIGNELSYQAYTDFKTAMAKLGDTSNALGFTCAQKTNGYYLRIDLDVAETQIDKGTFALYTSSTGNLVCQVAVKEAFGWTCNDAARRLVRKGLRKLSRELQKAQPSLLKG